jgi:RNA polymerase sigma-70 factor (ECF subfamily)
MGAQVGCEEGRRLGGERRTSWAARAEAEVVARARRGDTVAFEQLYRAHRDRVYTLCLSLCGDAEEAQDLLQDTFLRAYRSRRQFRGEAQFATWLHRIAVNLYRDALRHRAREPVPAAPARPPDTEAAELAAQVRTALARLQPAHRIVLALRYSQSLSYQEIAALLRWSLPRVKVTIHRAKRAFRDTYLQMGHEHEVLHSEG